MQLGSASVELKHHHLSSFHQRRVSDKPRTRRGWNDFERSVKSFDHGDAARERRLALRRGLWSKY